MSKPTETAATQKAATQKPGTETTAAESETADTVATLLAGAGLHPSTEVFELLVAAYPLHKQGIESLCAIAEARYDAPALVFNPTPVFEAWPS